MYEWYNIIYKMCACAMCMHCQCYVRYFFQERKTKKKKIPVASSRFFLLFFSHLFSFFLSPFVHLSFIFLSWHIHDLMHMKRVEYCVHSYRAHKHFSILLGPFHWQKEALFILYKIDACSICAYSSGSSPFNW